MLKKILIFSLFVIFRLNAQISPGDLSNSHAQFEGISNCTKCHELGKGVVNYKCLACHGEIQNLINQNRGYHSSWEVSGKPCQSCHSDHNGRGYQMVKFNRNGFDHNRAKFGLVGKHGSLDCNKCHQPKYIKDGRVVNRRNTLLGLEQPCLACHEDYHQNTIQGACTTCHIQDSWKPAPGFDHNRSAYILTGAHARIDCSRCHRSEQRNGREIRVFKPLYFDACIRCHQDKHGGKFGQNCQDCHITESFKQLKPGSFNHDKTEYKLIGKHLTVSCSKCHGQDVLSKPKHEKCIDCHKDYHNAEFKTADLITDCNSCHDVEGFTPSQFTMERHNKGKFVLTGAHPAQPCQSCHYKEKIWHFKPIETECIACHKNVHGTELKEKFMPSNKCESCHTTEKWKVVNFDHNSTSFKLEGKHANQTCITCHVININPDEREYRFASVKSNCETCHKDAHYGQFRIGEVTNCQDCHTSIDWKPKKFDHEKTRFSLLGAHSKLVCNECHKVVEKNGVKFRKFKMEDFKCATCHS